jgi:hypothetical protein
MAILLGVVGFAMVNLFAVKWYNGKKKSVEGARQQAELTLQNARAFLEMREQFSDEIDWLAKHEPEPAAVQEIESALQRFVQEEAIKAGLTVKRQKIQPADRAEGALYHRARVEFEVSGSESALYSWLYKLQSPEQFRAPTSLRLTPERDDDTKIACTVVVEQWFIPQPVET